MKMIQVKYIENLVIDHGRVNASERARPIERTQGKHRRLDTRLPGVLSNLFRHLK